MRCTFKMAARSEKLSAAFKSLAMRWRDRDVPGKLSRYLRSAATVNLRSSMSAKSLLVRT
jgi:hypothetical protein